MDTAYLEQQITAKEQEITDRQKAILLLKTQIDTDKNVLKILKRGLEKIKEQSK